MNLDAWKIYRTNASRLSKPGPDWKEKNEKDSRRNYRWYGRSESYRVELTLENGMVHRGANDVFAADFDTEEIENGICFSDDDGMGLCIPASYITDIKIIE